MEAYLKYDFTDKVVNGVCEGSGSKGEGKKSKTTKWSYIIKLLINLSRNLAIHKKVLLKGKRKILSKISLLIPVL